MDQFGYEFVRCPTLPRCPTFSHPYQMPVGFNGDPVGGISMIELNSWSSITCDVIELSFGVSARVGVWYTRR